LTLNYPRKNVAIRCGLAVADAKTSGGGLRKKKEKSLELYPPKSTR